MISRRHRPCLPVHQESLPDRSHRGGLTEQISRTAGRMFRSRRLLNLTRQIIVTDSVTAGPAA
jgi:hypothetical protein